MPRRKVLADENIPEQFLNLDPAKYEVVHVNNLGLKGTENGDLLKSAATRGFDLLITSDGSIRQEQKHKMQSLPVGILVLTNADVPTLRRLKQTITKAIDLVKKGQYATLETKQRPVHGDREHTRGTLEFAPETVPRPTAQQVKDAHQLPGLATREMSQLAAAEQKRQADQLRLQKAKDHFAETLKRLEQIQSSPARSKKQGRMGRDDDR